MTFASEWAHEQFWLEGLGSIASSSSWVWSEAPDEIDFSKFIQDSMHYKLKHILKMYIEK